MLELILSKENMNTAYFRVKENGGAAGIDGMKASELQSYLNNAWSGLKAAIMEGSYVLQTRVRIFNRALQKVQRTFLMNR
jgi:retron-type reverse transcriptase